MKADERNVVHAGAPSGIKTQRRDGLEQAIGRSREALLLRQEEQGSWCFELEADCTIPAEYILMMHFMDEIDSALQERIAIYLRDHQADHGGWPLYYAGDLDLSATVKSYWALKLAGDDPEAEHMRRARTAVLAAGGAARCNVFTRIAMALFGQVPWRATPIVPVEIIMLPRWFPFHLRKVSYWTRTVVVPLSILCSLKAQAKNPTGIDIRELFTTAPDVERDYFPVRSGLNRLFLAIERSVRLFEPLIPGFVRRRAMQRALGWIDRRLNGTDGLGGIFPAMVNAYEAYDRLGIAPDDPRPTRAREALRRLLVHHDDWSYCSPCFSPVWDTALASLALLEADSAPETSSANGNGAPGVERAYTWLESVQVLDGPADWRKEKPSLAPGGWAFQYRNPHYPDLDDTAAVVWGMALCDRERYAGAIQRATNWLAGMQSENGGFGAFDADNSIEYLNEIPFADHGALLDPPTADVSARCALVFALLGRADDAQALERVLRYLFDQQEFNGSWYGRWGTNYIYGTWSVLMALEHVDDPRKDEPVRRAVAWLKSVQAPDGGWGESNDTYYRPYEAGRGETTPCQTAWALLALLSAGEGACEEVQRGVRYLIAAQQADGLWTSDFFNAPGFPRVFHLCYHGYQAYFPLWALARVRRFEAENVE